MTETDVLSRAFEAERERLRALAYRMLGSAAEAEDAVQEVWLRLHSADAGQIGNLGGWLTTVVSRISLDMLRSRKTRREAPLVKEEVEPVLNREQRPDPEQEALLAEAVGIGLMVVLERLEPAERLAFVLHDLFGLPFEEIAPIVGRSNMAARQLASRARRRLRGEEVSSLPQVAEQRRLVAAFFVAARDGDFEGLLKVLDPDVALTADPSLLPPGAAPVMRGAAVMAKRATIGAAQAAAARIMLVNEGVGIIVAPRGRLRLAMAFEVSAGLITAIEVISEPGRLAALRLRLLDA